MLKVKNILFFLMMGGAVSASLFLVFSLYYEIDMAFSYLSAHIAGTKPFHRVETIRLRFVGDVMLDRGVETSIKNNGEGEFTFAFENCHSFLQEADILFGNLESVVSDRGVRVGSRYSFRAEPEAIKGLAWAGFDVVSVANNHVFDYSRAAMEDSFKRLEKAGIEVAGGGFSFEEACASRIIEKKGIKVAFLAYTDLAVEHWAAGEDSSGICWLDQRMAGQVDRAAKEADIVVVSMHFGDEYREKPNKEQKSLARKAIDSGADLVIGHHPHVVQPTENYNNGFIAYSLGNFVFDQDFSEETMKGLAIEAEVSKKKVETVASYVVKLNKRYQPEIIN